MSANAPRSEDYKAYFEADIGFTWAKSATTSLAQNTDDEGPLAPGRYIAVARNFSDEGALLWLHVGPFVKATPLAPVSPTGQGKARIPLNDRGSVEFVVCEHHNDRFGVIMSAGTGLLHLTKVSRKTEVASA